MAFPPKMASNLQDRLSNLRERLSNLHSDDSSHPSTLKTSSTTPSSHVFPHQQRFLMGFSQKMASTLVKKPSWKTAVGEEKCAKKEWWIKFWAWKGGRIHQDASLKVLPASLKALPASLKSPYSKFERGCCKFENACSKFEKIKNLKMTQFLRKKAFFEVFRGFYEFLRGI